MNEHEKKALARLMGHDPAYVDQEKVDAVSREQAIAKGLPVPLTGLDKEIAEADRSRAAQSRDDDWER